MHDEGQRREAAGPCPPTALVSRTESGAQCLQSGQGQRWPQHGNICHTVHRLLISAPCLLEKKGTPQRTSPCVSSSTWQDWICWTYTSPPLRYAECIVPKTHFCEGQTFPTGWRETCKLPLALLSAVTGLGCTWSLWHQSPVAEHLCCFQEQPAGKCQLTCRSGAGWRCHVSSNALRGTAALREITPAHQIGDITLWTLTILSFVTEDPYNQLPLPAVFGNNKTL